MKPRIFFWIPFLFLFYAPFCHADSASGILVPYQQSPAYQQYQKRPKSELSKILYLMDRFRERRDFKVVLSQVEYDSEQSLKYAKDYIARHYHQEKAKEWVMENAYRGSDGNIFYLKYPDGQQKILRDALVEELKRIEA